jgi:hypothetical protein
MKNIQDEQEHSLNFEHTFSFLSFVGYDTVRGGSSSPLIHSRMISKSLGEAYGRDIELLGVGCLSVR